MDKPWMWAFAIGGGVLGGVLMQESHPTQPLYHYEERVEIVAGFYAGQSGTVEKCSTTIMGVERYTIHLKDGGWAYDIAGADLKLIPLE